MVYQATVPSIHLIPAIIDLLAEGSSVRLTVTGNSMVPFLHHERDSVELSRSSSSGCVRRGDIVLARTQSGYLLHRVLHVREKAIYLLGDAQAHPEGPFFQDQILAVVTTIWRNGKRISVKDKRWRFTTVAWLALYPLRPLFFSIAGRLPAFIRRLDWL